MKKRKFEDWEYSEVNREFGYKRHYKNFTLLETWQACQEIVTESELARLEVLQERLFHNAEAWNEDELKFMFISPLTDLVNFYSEQYKIFTQRKFAATIGEWQVNGVVDLVVSRGEQHPEQPFFFLHEYKQERKRDNDPLGQLLIAMVVAQHQNEVQIPLYGCYVVGRNYFFVALHGQEYSVSNAYNAASLPDLLLIFKMMRFVKQYIEQLVSA